VIQPRKIQVLAKAKKRTLFTTFMCPTSIQPES
jgi:hypothetical protein